MDSDSVQHKLSNLSDTYWYDVERLAEKIMEEVVKPFCEENGLNYVSSFVHPYFYFEKYEGDLERIGDSLVLDGKVLQRSSSVLAILLEELIDGDPIGSLVDNYEYGDEE
jgi:hypothetical protein